MKSEFVHLHVHSDHSLLDGACKIGDLIKKVDALGMRAVGLTDHGNLFGAVEFYQRALERGVKPIIGIEAYVAPGRRTDRRDVKGIRESSHHLTLLVRNETGYRNLLKLSTIAFQEGFYYKPRMDKEILAAHSDGLLALSGCPSSEFAHGCRFDMLDRAFATADELSQIFGKEHFFLEVQNHGLQEEKNIIRGAIEASKKLGLKIAATNDTHYLSKDDSRAHDVLLAICTGKLVSDPDRLRMATPEFFLKSPQEMAAAFPELPEAVQNTLAVAEQCNLELRFDEIHLPPFPLPEGVESAAVHLRRLCEEGARRRYGEITETIRSRLDHELTVIEQMGFSSYFLIVWDIRRYARESGIRVGPGRGSAAGSIVAYVLGITNIDPIRYDLIFERFLNPGRREMPDIDVDFSTEDRPRVLKYLRDRYGHDNVAQIITFGKMKARAVLRDVGRAMGMEYKDVDRLAKKVPRVLNITLREARQQEPELAQMIDSDTQVREIWEVGQRLEGLSRHASKHASGVVVSDKPLVEYVPLYVAGEEVTTQYEMNAVARLGLLKIDVLGLETLTVLDRALGIVEETKGEKINLERIPLDDRKTFEMLGRGHVKGVFQLETSRGMRELVQKMKPDCIEDLIATIALFRPGPLQSGMEEQYIRCKHGLEKPSYVHPSLEPILRETHGVMLYQEQVMRIANRLAGFPMSDADALRKAMGKKKPELIAQYKDQFIGGAKERKIDEDTARQIFDLMAHFAGYGFNKSHSAAYGIISYQTAYLKANHPVEYMAALMSCSMGNTDKLAAYLEECRRLDIEVLPPDVNESTFDFRVMEGRVRFGLGSVKGAGERAIEAIVQGRKDGPYKTFFDFCDRVDNRAVDRKSIENLIKCGAFDATGSSRAALLESMEAALRMANVMEKDRKAGQLTMFGGPEEERSEDPDLPEVPEWPQDVLLAFEKEALGLYVTSNPVVEHEETIRTLSSTTVDQLGDLEDGTEVRIGGIISNLRQMITRQGPNRGNKYVLLQFADLTGSCEAVAFSKVYEQEKEHLVNDNIVFVVGRISFRGDAPSIRINEVIPIEQARERLTGSIHIALSPAGLEEPALLQLRDVLNAHPGTCRVFLEVGTADGRKVKIGTTNSYFVSPSEGLIADIDEVLGAGHVRFAGRSGS